ncbi:TetR family transcriptional regulator [Streptomyces venezuelae]|uniref:TetR family transcriptional regulator n=1 Tax=Streptomyces venezuelae TaxID=54571 RepID=A0A5P2D3E3_STRVZ|nr:TetR/AcrR family transcriptional regulator C-terminal domain-containing protein [Streptomyces venezuelae]QES49060.1 TetR family transcriptional regulator [Streptomyces venezuelae]
MVTSTEPARISVWLAVRASGGQRRRPGGTAPSGLDRERITGAAVELLDADGLGRFSMRRLAGRLGVTAMSLYWYVDTKHDLLELALDRVMGELALPPAPASGPRAAAGWDSRLRKLAGGYRRVLAGHPWAGQLAAEYPNIGPHARGFDTALLRTLESAGLAEPARAGAHLAVIQFLQGCGGTVRRSSEEEFRAALEVLVAGIEANTGRPA